MSKAIKLSEFKNTKEPAAKPAKRSYKLSEATKRKISLARKRAIKAKKQALSGSTEQAPASYATYIKFLQLAEVKSDISDKVKAGQLSIQSLTIGNKTTGSELNLGTLATLSESDSRKIIDIIRGAINRSCN